MFAWVFLVSVRLLNTVAPASDTQDQINEEEAHKQQTLAMLKALLQFYQESEVKIHLLVQFKALYNQIMMLCVVFHDIGLTRVSAYAFSCTSMWCT